MSGTYTGSGRALVVSSKCNKLVDFTSSYTWSIGGDGSDDYLYKIEYNNSLIGSRTLSAVIDLVEDEEICSDKCLNFITNYFVDEDTGVFFVYVTINGVYKKCNYSSYEIDVESAALSAASRDVLKKKSRSSEEFHKLLDSKADLKKKYLEIKAKLGK